MNETSKKAADTRSHLHKYEEICPLYDDLVKAVDQILHAVLDQSGIKIASICGRVKTYQSLMDKARRKVYKRPCEQVTDLAGVRVVCYYDTDLEAIKQIIRSKFLVHEEVSKTGSLGVDRMGYQGDHFIIALGHDYSSPKYDGILDLKCEIQVRTILQDAWAMISHHLVYKNEASVPGRIRRDINNVASLLEIAQGIFDAVRENRSAYLKEIQAKTTVIPDFLSQPIDYDTLAAYTQWKFPDLPISEHWQTRLLADLNRERYHSLRDIDCAVKRAENALRVYRKENPDWFKCGTDYVTKSLGFVDREFRRKHPWGGKTKEAFERLGHLVGGA